MSPIASMPRATRSALYQKRCVLPGSRIEPTASIRTRSPAMNTSLSISISPTGLRLSVWYSWCGQRNLNRRSGNFRVCVRTNVPTHSCEPNWRSSSGLARKEFRFLAFSLRIRIAASREYGRLYGVSESLLRDIESTQRLISRQYSVLPSG